MILAWDTLPGTFRISSISHSRHNSKSPQVTLTPNWDRLTSWPGDSGDRQGCGTSGRRWTLPWEHDASDLGNKPMILRITHDIIRLYKII